MYDYVLGITCDYLNFPIAIYFLLITILGDSRYKVHAFIICMFSMLAFFTAPDIGNEIVRASTKDEYIKDVGISVLWDGATALILTMFMVFDRVAWKQALLLAFAVLCHSMIIYDLTIASSIFSNVFYTWYDELIIAVGLLQMGVSYNGFTTALSNLQTLIPRFFLYSISSSKSLFTRKERETKT